MIGIERRGPNGAIVFVLIVIAAVVVALQYTPFALFPPEQTSMLWGILVGLVIGGFLFGWLRFASEDSE